MEVQGAKDCSGLLQGVLLLKKPRVVVVDLDVTEEQEVVLQMEGEEMLMSGTVQLEDDESADGTSGAPSTVILSETSDVTRET